MKFLPSIVAFLVSSVFLFLPLHASTDDQTNQKSPEDLTIHGIVVSVDVGANTIIVKTKHHQDTLVH